MSKISWKSTDELSDRTKPVRTAEFSTDVARAIAELRATAGISNVSCEEEGNSPEELDQLRESLREAMPGLSRRGFLQITGAAAVFALAACDKKHPDTLVPYAQQPEGTTIGNAVYFSTTLRDSGQAVGVMVKCYDGRPIKIEGNPDHPLSRGRCDTRTQAALLNLYDPDRLQHGPQVRSGDVLTNISWDALDQAVGAAMAQGTIGLLTGAIDSPAEKRLIQDFATAFGTRFHHGVLESFPRASEREARKRSLGQASLPTYRADLASVMVSFGDFLGGGTTGLAEQIEFGELRRLKNLGDKGSAEKAFSGQVISFEPTMSQVGTCSDIRVRVAHDQLALAAWGIAEQVAKQLHVTLPGKLQQALDQVRGKSLDETLELKPVSNAAETSPLAYAAARLIDAKNAGKHSLIYAGGASQCGDDSLPLHLAVVFLNHILGNEGSTVITSGENAALNDDGSGIELLKACKDGQIQTLIVWGVNPAYVWPASMDALKAVPVLVSLADRVDETAAYAKFIAPSLHGLESWGDAEGRAGIYSLQQPCIAPLWDCRAAQESVMTFGVLSGAKLDGIITEKKPFDPKWVSVINRRPLWQASAAGIRTWQDYVRSGWITAIKKAAGIQADDRSFWNAALSKGVVVVPQKLIAATNYRLSSDISFPVKPAGMRLILNASRTMGDGSALNNALLQEMPDPVSKICWDNYLAMSPTDAQARAISNNDVVSISVEGKTAFDAPVHVQEGQHPGTLELFFGWGRTHAGEVADLSAQHDGFRINAFALNDARPCAGALNAEITKTTRTYQLANTQGHDYTEGRPVALEMILDPTARANSGKEGEERALWRNGTDGKVGGDISMWGTHHTYPGHRWGMSVDMNTCIGCNACVAACHAENNVPVVGRDEVRKGRWLHWIRIDRYYTGSFDKNSIESIPGVTEKPAPSLLDVEVVHQPMLCQQCENAPCEAVCPANATMHNNEGISVQVYNRCVGTRYCANNCPYKVRRFNWYEYSKYRAGPVDSGKPMERIVRNLATTGATSSQAELSHAPLQLMLNPEVTVRSRGVMEKCNFCIQRTRTIRDKEHSENRRIQDGEITTACAQTCPTKALVFGDLSDPTSEVVRISTTAGNAYKLLDKELNTRPSVAYLRRVRNRPAQADEIEGGHTQPGAPAAAPARESNGKDAG